MKQTPLKVIIAGCLIVAFRIFGNILLLFDDAFPDRCSDKRACGCPHKPEPQEIMLLIVETGSFSA